MKDKIMHVVIAVVIVEILCLTVGSIFVMLGMFDLTTGCVMRYDTDTGGASYSDSINQSMVLRADGNYTATATSVNGKTVVVRDPAKYGQWQSAKLSLDAGQKVNLSIDGNISLCTSYLPANNIGSKFFDPGSNSLKDTYNPAVSPIAVPRLEDSAQGPLTLVFDARVVGWRNLLEVYPGDEVEVILKDNRASVTDQGGAIKQITEPNIFTGGNFPAADCSEGKQTYSPVCGRWSLWNGTQQYMSYCTYHYGESPACGTECCNEDAFGTCWDAIWDDPCYRSCVSDIPSYSLLPQPYKENGTVTQVRINDYSSMLNAPFTNISCTVQDQGSVNQFNTKAASYKYWFSARDAAALMYRYNASVTADVAAGGGYSQAAIQDPTGDLYPDSYTGRKLVSVKYSDNRTAAYLQYRFYGDAGSRTGGYVFQVKHTKCARGKGEVITDKGYANRGQILYVVSDKNPNTDPGVAQSAQVVPPPNNGNTTITAGNKGNLWLKIDNKFADYKDSTGEYKIMLSFQVARAVFVDNIVTPLLSTIKNRLNTAGMQIFQNLICFKQDVNGSCHNFFNYIKAILTLYILIYGLMFLSGVVKVSYQDLVIRVAKIGLVGGLISGQTFLWFNDYLFNFIVDFTNQIIANFAGFSNISNVNAAAGLTTDFNNIPANNNAGAPFMFLNTIFTKVFFSKTFLVQLFAIMGIGMVGLLYFVIVGVGFVLFIIVGLRAIAVYIIAMIATAFLISLAPIFLTFMLFQRTFYLFENWYKALFRYMMEPVILMIGVIVLTQIFTLYMDNILSYSACWKCAIAFYLPFGDLLPLPGLANMPLFCIYWFGPWGLDSSGASGQLGMDLVSMLGLVIITFAIYGYADLATQIAARLTAAGVNAPSSIGTGLHMARSIEQHYLRKEGLDDRTQAQLKHQQGQKRAASREALKTQEKAIAKEEKELGISHLSDSEKFKQSALKAGSGALKATSKAVDAASNFGKGVKDSASGAMRSGTAKLKEKWSEILDKKKGAYSLDDSLGQNNQGSDNKDISGYGNTGQDSQALSEMNKQVRGNLNTTDTYGSGKAEQQNLSAQAREAEKKITEDYNQDQSAKGGTRYNEGLHDKQALKAHEAQNLEAERQRGLNQQAMQNKAREGAETGGPSKQKTGERAAIKPMEEKKNESDDES